MMADSNDPPMIVGQNSHSRFWLSIIMQVFKSVKPLVSQCRNGSLHLDSSFRFRAPQIEASPSESSEPLYHEAIRSPFGHSTMPGAWVWVGLTGKICSASCQGVSAEGSARMISATMTVQFM